MDHPTVRAFIAFRIFFTARFYYPIFMILFLDFGLSIEDFALLNAIWAVVIILLEVPSGAVADIVGRRALVVLAGLCMVFEIGLLCLVPLGNHSLVFAVFLINRLLSGMAEAAASGADEALAYDALKSVGEEGTWPRVMERLTQLRSMAMFVAMISGAVVYDPGMLNWVSEHVGGAGWSKAETVKLPLWLNLITAFLTLGSALAMRDVGAGESDQVALDPAETGEVPSEALGNAEGSKVVQAFRVTLATGRWILRTPVALLVILAGLLFDHVGRQLLTMSSEYFRAIAIPVGLLGVLGAVSGLTGLVFAGLGRRLLEERTPLFNFGVLVVLTLASVGGMALAIPYWGLLFALGLGAVMTLTNTFVSQYLNQLADSSQRATVLSFKGVAMNLGYGTVGFLTMALVASLRGRPEMQGLAESQLDRRVFLEALLWFPGWFLALLVVFLIAAWRIAGTTAPFRQIGGCHRLDERESGGAPE